MNDKSIKFRFSKIEFKKSNFINKFFFSINVLIKIGIDPILKSSRPVNASVSNKRKNILILN